MGSTIQVVDIPCLVSKLTVEEKVSLLAAKDWWRIPVIEREGVYVPQIKTTDGPNGARGESYVSGIKAACFPCATSLGASFDTAAVFKTGQEVAKEAISKAADVLLAPTLNVIRSPLGGRNYETYSEDPVILGHLAAAYVNGCQSQGIAATPKHFVANDAENQRTTLSVKIDEQTLREIYLYPFQLVLKLSTPHCIMTSYNKVEGTYVSESPRLIEDVLRKEWGFQGLVMSDWMGTYSTAAALNAGLDLEMPGPTKWRGKKLLAAISSGEVTEEVLNKSTARVLKLMKDLGRFEAPHGERPEQALENRERDEFIRDAAAEGMVLLKNDGDVLPLPKDARIAITGYHARVVSLGGGGSARVDALHAINPLEGLDALGIPYNYSPGVPVFGALPHADPAIISKTKIPGKTNEVLSGISGPPKLVRLEWFNGHEIGKNLVHEELVQNAEYMIKEAWPQYLNAEYCTRLTFDVTPRTSGPHILSVISTGLSDCFIDGTKVFHRPQEKHLRPESFYFFKSKIERRFAFAMEAGRTYTLQLTSWNCDPDILNAAPIFGKMFQGSALRFFEHVDIEKAIKDAAESAAQSEYALVCVGTTNEVESEGYDRETMDLPGSQYDLIKAVAAVNPNTIVVNFSGSPIIVNFADHVPTILQAWFPGQECGHSLARVLTGLTNPSGRLPFTWPWKLEDNPSFGNFPAEDNLIHYEEGLNVGYRYYSRENSPTPQYAFGFGLSYTTFAILDAVVSSTIVSPGPDGTLSVSSRVKNTGHRQGKVVVQFYVTIPETSVGQARPPFELQAFQKLDLQAGQEEVVKVILDRYAFSVYDAEACSWRAIKGEYEVHVGLSSDKFEKSAKFVVPEEFTWRGI